MTAGFEIRGAAEAFYGVFYTAPERQDLIRFVAQSGYNYYLYGPKNDRPHRNRWREPYPAKAMRGFAETVAVAEAHGVTFCYSLGPVVTMSYASEADFDFLKTKLAAFHEIGVRAFNLTLDDMQPRFQYAADALRFASFAEAHVYLCNRVYAWLQQLDASTTLSMCPTLYHGRPPFEPYLHELGDGLHPAIDVFYTGPEVCSYSIDAMDAAAFGEVLQRRPMIWDNYPVNDLAMQPELHLGPIRRRDPGLADVCKGVVANLMLQAEASKIPLLTLAEYLRDPWAYLPEVAWGRAVRAVAGEDSSRALKLLADSMVESCLGSTEAETLKNLAVAALDALKGGECAQHSPAVHALDTYLEVVDEACYHLKYGMDNLALRNNLLPWIELVEAWGWVVRYGFGVLRKIEQGIPFDDPLWRMREYYTLAQGHHKHAASTLLRPLADYLFGLIDRE